MSLRAVNKLFKLGNGNFKLTYCILRHLNGAAGEAISSTQNVKETIHKTDFVDTEKTPDIVAQLSYKPVQSFSLTSDSRFRTNESDTAKHTYRHEGLFYTIPEEDFKKIMPPSFKNDLPIRTQASTFNEACLMVRKPAIEIIDLMNNHINYQLPAQKFMLYGKAGVGKTFSLVHLLHYCYQHNWIVLHLPWPYGWIRHYKDWTVSEYRPGRINVPEDAKVWLEQFKASNFHLIEDLKTHFNYTWTIRDTLEAGAPFTELIEFGVKRIKYADDVVGAVLKELRHLANTDRVKVLIAVDGINSFWFNFDIYMGKGKTTTFPAKSMSLVHHFFKHIKNGMKNSVTVCTIDVNLVRFEERENYTPLCLLGKEGFEDMDPFIPIEVKNYSHKEIYSQIYYYINRKWITNEKAMTADGMQELIALSCMNPLALGRICASC